MSISSALQAATSGLAAVSRGTETVATNIANAATENYGRRELGLSSNPYAGGVRMEGINRMINSSVLAEYRIAAADTANAATITEYHKTIETAIGLPNSGKAISDRVAAFEGALALASAQPDSTIQLGQVLSTATDLVRSINALGVAAQDARQQAENSIGRDVELLNQGLAEIARLNRTIAVETATGRDTAALADARQKAIDGLAEIVPLSEVRRDNGHVSLFTASGAALLDGTTPVKIEFQALSHIGPENTAATGDLAYLTIDGQTLTNNQMGLYAGGRLSASFDIRDTFAPSLQDQADQLAHNLSQRFGADGPDPTISAGMPGLFTDAAAATDAPPTVGLAQRLAINTIVDPSSGGQLARLRDGIYAATAGDSGDAGLLTTMIAALREPQGLSGLGTDGPSRGMTGHAADLSSAVSTQRVRSEATLAGTTARHHALNHALATGGVDTDRELERLLALEQAYAANARVIKAVDTMLNAILGI